MKIHPSLKILPRSILFQRELFVPHFLVKVIEEDLNEISFNQLQKNGIKGVVFDKDNTLTVPHKKEIFPTVEESFEKCKAVYGKNAIIFSNSAGSYQDPGYSKAIELEESLGIPVLRHNTKKPDGIEFITKYFNCEPNQLAIIGDRFFTDVLFGNMNGMLTICTRPLVIEPSPVMQKVIDYESKFVLSLINGGLKPPKHPLYNPAFILCELQPRFKGNANQNSMNFKSCMEEDPTLAFTRVCKLPDQLTQHVPKSSSEFEIERINIPGKEDHNCFLVYNFLSAEECKFLIDQTEKLGYNTLQTQYSADYRDNDRVMIDDPQLVDLVWEKIKSVVPANYSVKHPSKKWSGEWKLEGINERFRFCRYFKGGHFTAHRDAVFRRTNNERSILTFMIYLNSESQDFEGGTTNFLDEKTKEIQYSVVPRTGMAIIFDHRLFHEGGAVKEGKKYIMRSDIMYKRE